MGTRIEARVIEMDRNRNNVVLSRRVVLEESRKAERSEILSKLKSGMRLQAPFPPSSLRRLRRPRRYRRPHPHLRALLEPRQPSFRGCQGRPGGRGRGSRRRSQPRAHLPWSQADHRGSVARTGQEVPRRRYRRGTVTKLVPFGAFVDLGEGIEGLVHISEMANKHVDQPSQVTTWATRFRSRSWRSTSTVVVSPCP